MTRQALNQFGMLSTEPAVVEVYRATGGWPMLLEEVLGRLPAPLDNLDPRPVCAEVERELAKGGALAARFLGASGLGALPLGGEICKIATALEPGDFGEVAFDLVQGARSQQEVDHHIGIMRRLSILTSEGGKVVCNHAVRRALGL